MTLFHQIYSHLSLALILVWMSFTDSVSASRCSCYTFDGKLLRLWSQGQTLCRNNDGNLVSMETIAEWEFIKTQIQNESTFDDKNEWWIGLVRRDGKWRWLSNQSLTYDKWDRGKPISDFDKTSVRMIKEYPQGTYGHFSNMKKDIQRSGTICEYHEKECTNNPGRLQWCPETTTPSKPTTITTSSTIGVTTLRQSPTTRITLPIDIGKGTDKRELSTGRISTIRQPVRGLKDSGIKTTFLVHTNCLPYPLLVIAIFVSVVGGLTALIVVVLLLIHYIMRKKRKLSENHEMRGGDHENQL